ncbi:ABC transporter ATP-binding protein [Phytohabitans kaempferiae]|uniref:ABC transporter ATP-binding protein n=1 Tax=Phytohabitans kaempferiae TaxID=1620943 RepID=A0ABV6M3U1_9ACTN
MTDDVLTLSGITKHYRVPRRGAWAFGHQPVHAADDADLTLRRGETLALVGESGSGKSTLARIALGLTRPTRGEVALGGVPLASMSRRQVRRDFRSAVQAVFQDPAGSLNPRKTLLEILRGPMLLHGKANRSTATAAVTAILEQVGLSPGTSFLHRYPHELSGGQQQRVAIARALSTEPRVVVADEPVSALDVSVRAQILELLRDLQRQRGIALLLITHDLAVVRAIAHRVAVMYLGRIVETGDPDEIFTAARHPYTRALIDATPHPVPGARPLARRLTGEPPSAIHLPSGCRFSTRCPDVMDVCRAVEPLPLAAGSGHVSCHLHTHQPVAS